MPRRFQQWPVKAGRWSPVMASNHFRKPVINMGGLFLLLVLLTQFTGCKKEENSGSAKNISIAVFIPGVMSGGAIYEMLAQGVRQAADEKTGVDVRVIEAGFNQAEWEGKLTSLAAAGTYDLIVSSNPSLPALAQSVSAKFPKQHFLLLDGEISGNPMIYTLRYNQYEQAYMAGYLAALIAREGKTKIGPAEKIGLVAGQEYPAMNDIILPSYLEGARAVSPAFETDFRVVGNWYDAGKGAELASDIIRRGAPVILCVAGGANEGVVKAAEEAGAKVIWFDINGYAVRPGVVVGSCILRQDKAAYEKTKLFLEGKLPFGSAEMVGVKEGFVDFVDDDPLYISSVSESVRAEQAVLLEALRSGRVIIKN